MRLSQYIVAFGLSFLLSCKSSPRAIVPYYLRVEEPKLIIDSDTVAADIRDVWVYPAGRFLSAGEVPFEIPINDYYAREILLAGGVWESGITVRRAVYPFWQFDTLAISPVPESQITYKPIFRYVVDTLLQPLLEETFESPQLNLRSWGDYPDAVSIQRSLDEPWRGFWCGKLFFPEGSSAIWSVVSPRAYTFSKRDTWLEIRLRGNINLGVGIVVTDRRGEISRQIFLVLIPQESQWQSYYINMTPWIQKIPDFQQFRLYLFTQSDQKERFLYIDDIRWLTFRNL
ncbi:MAG: hypothetical protein ACUVRD_02505 [Bacteroidia bacterium]